MWLTVQIKFKEQASRGGRVGFETQGRCHQKSKTGVSVAPRKGLMPSKFFLKRTFSHTSCTSEFTVVNDISVTSLTHLTSEIQIHTSHHDDDEDDTDDYTHDDIRHTGSCLVGLYCFRSSGKNDPCVTCSGCKLVLGFCGQFCGWLLFRFLCRLDVRG